MLGRAAYADPYLLAAVDRALFGANDAPPSRLDVLDRSRLTSRRNSPAARGSTP